PQVHEVARATIERHLEVVGLNARSVDHRLIVAGQKSVRIIDLRKADWRKIFLEELSRRLRAPCGKSRQGRRKRAARRVKSWHCRQAHGSSRETRRTRRRDHRPP